MALENPPYVLQSASHSAALFRQAAGSLIGGTGVVTSTDLAVTANGTPNMSVNVAAGQIWMPGTLGATTGFPANGNAQTGYGLPSAFTSQGPYYGYQDSTVNLVISASDPTNPRIDLICASVQDSQYSGSSNQPVLQVITGTPAPSPAAPAAPPSTVVVAQVLVPANTTSITSGDITDERPFVALQSPGRRNPAGRLYATATQSVTSTATQINTTTVAFLYGGMATSGGVLYVPVAGLYRVSAFWGGGGPPNNAVLTVAYGHNSSSAIAQIIGGGTTYASGGAQIVPAFGSDLVQCAANDFLSFLATAESATNTETTPGWYPYLAAELVSQ